MNDRQRLARLLNAKERLRDLKRIELSEADRALWEAQAQAAEANQKLQEAVEELTGPGDRTAADLAMHASLVAAADHNLARAQEAVLHQQTQRHECAHEVQVAAQEAKAIEHRVAAAAAAELRAIGRAEQATADEWSGRRKGPQR